MAVDQQHGLYGGWRRATGGGIGSLGPGPSAAVVGALLTPPLAVTVLGPTSLLVTLPVALLLLALVVWRRHGMPVLSYLAARARWQLGAWRGETDYRATYLPALQALDLPGVAAPTRLLAVEGVAGGRQSVGLVWNQRTGTMSGTLLLSPAGMLLAPSADVTSSVSSWASTLARLAEEDMIQAASVTVQVTPASGRPVAAHVAGRLDKGAPTAARQAVTELVRQSPRASAQLLAWMTLVVDPARAADRPDGPELAAAETLRAIDAVDLTGTGADVLRQATPDDIKRLVLGGYRPAEADAPASQIAELMWHEVGPAAATDGWTTYQHDGSISASWVLREAPRRPVPYSALLRLLAPGRYARRVTLAYRVLPTEEAASVVERQVNATEVLAEYRRRTQRAATHRERVDAEHAARTAREEAVGAGMVQWSIYVTTTVTDPADLPAARKEVTKAAGAAVLRLRPAYGGQSAALALGLPLGINPLL
ncbi:hypothetical protein SAMN06297387_13117 [Streptomyces zhaozhouensis]|uniref:Type VII secretion protein EccE n=1 Tax=Streptomyces zhaozhouensis TaxID=1300267 RepID=A0A286E960_9ACTN|nr:SCO6880 family protein [Streptomyces zhaozhouensis]SOD67437.1 hypothetical protein SAMN06297387_13117 [Streptomyces zhaozhouensis]